MLQDSADNLKVTLEFYANPQNWIPQDESDISEVDKDNGELARVACETLDHMGIIGFLFTPIINHFQTIDNYHLER